MQQAVHVQLRVRSAVVDGARGGVPPRARDELARLDVADLAVDALSDHLDALQRGAHRDVDGALERRLELRAQLRLGERPHDADALGRRVREVQRDDPGGVGAGAPQRQARDRVVAVHDGAEGLRREHRVDVVEAERGGAERAEHPAPGRLDDVSVLQVVVAALARRGPRLQGTSCRRRRTAP